MVDRKIEYELSGTDIIRFDPKNISSSYRFLYRKDLRLSGEVNVLSSSQKKTYQSIKKKFSSNFTKQQIIIEKTTTHYFYHLFITIFAEPSGEGIICYDRIEKDAVGVVFIDNSEYELYFVQDDEVTISNLEALTHILFIILTSFTFKK